MPCTFEGTLTMDDGEFTYEYTCAAEDGAKYITFDGSIKISPTSGESIKLDADYIISDTFYDTIHEILHEIEKEVEDGSCILDEIIQYIILVVADKVIEEIKQIDNIDIDKDNKNEYVDYVAKNIIDKYSCELLDNKYKSIDTILNNYVAEDIKNGENSTITNWINDALDEAAKECTNTYEITAKVFFSDLDP